MSPMLHVHERLAGVGIASACPSGAQQRLTPYVYPLHSTILGRGNRQCGSGAAAAARAAAARPLTRMTANHSGGSTGIAMDEEVVDAIAVLERPGAVSSTQFQQHDHALQLCEQLQSFNSQLGAAIQSADTVLEYSEWDTLTLPADVHTEWKHLVRTSRKELSRARKEERRLRREQRVQERAARPAAQEEQQYHNTVTLANNPAAPDFPEQPAAGAVISSISMPQAPLSSVSSLPSQPTVRQRRRTPQQQLAQPLTVQHPQLMALARQQRSTAAPAAPAAGGSRSEPAVRDSTLPADAPPARAVPAAAAQVDTSRPLAPPSTASSRSSRAPAAAAVTPGAVAVAAPLSSVDSQAAVSTVGRSVPGFAPLSLLQQHSPATAGPVVSRRMQRGTGVSRQGRRASALSSGASSAPRAMPKLADNTLHGLDMRAELLTGEQEKELAVMVQDLLSLEAVFKELAASLGHSPTNEEWMEAAGAADSSADRLEALSHFMSRVSVGRSAKQAMVAANYKLVVSICRKYQGHGLTMADLINEGIAGLTRGVEKFDPTKGFKFSTYAHWWIRQAVSRSLADQGRLIRLPTHMQELLAKVSKASKVFEGKHGRQPTAHELAPQVGVEASRIKDLWDAVVSPRSLDQPQGGDADSGTLGDVLEDDRIIGSEEAVYMESLKQDLESVLEGLPERDAGVLRMRFGLADGLEYTLDEVGAKYKVTRERIRQIEAKAIRQLRAHHIQPGSAVADYQHGDMSDKQLAARTSSGTKKS